MRQEDIIIVGSGPYGIGLAVELQRLGKFPLVLERGDKPAYAWRSRHPQLRLNTHRWNSGLPDHPLPKSAGRWPGRDDYVDYLDTIARDSRCRIETGKPVQRIDRAREGWRLDTGIESFTVRQVIFATGFDQRPEIPKWPGLAKYQGKLIHTSDLGAVEQYRGKSILVVGAGNSGVDALNCLVDQPLKSLSVSVRSGPVVVPAELFGMPLQLTAPLLERLPRRMADMALAATEQLAFGDLRKLGLRRKASNTFAASRLANDFVAPAVDRGFIQAVRRGKVTLYPEIKRFEDDRIEFVNGDVLTANVVICATGYSCGLEPIVGHLGVLGTDGRPVKFGRPVLDGLWFALMPPPLGGSLRAIARAVRPMARAIAEERPFALASAKIAGHGRFLPEATLFGHETLEEGH